MSCDGVMMARLCNIAEAYVSGVAAAAYKASPCLRVGQLVPESWLSKSGGGFGQGLFLDPQLRGQAMDPNLEKALQVRLDYDWFEVVGILLRHWHMCLMGL
eukprot:scaffold135816_cov21-Prasinocladus_malaysianus.AAC.1